jgi:hypothetical protein
MTKMFTVVGTAVLNGQQKFRVANGTAAARTAVMARAGAEDINLIDLDTPMTKDAAIEFFQNQSTGKKRNEKMENLTKRAKDAKAVKGTVTKTENGRVRLSRAPDELKFDVINDESFPEPDKLDTPKFEDVNSLALTIENEILEPARGAKFDYKTRKFEDEAQA